MTDHTTHDPTSDTHSEPARRAVCPSVEPVTAPNLEALALENAVEGCVRETFGALCGGYQAARAADPVVRRTLAQITRDETTHALVS